MNQKEKVIDALNNMLAKKDDLLKIENTLMNARKQSVEADLDFIRVLKAVYGERVGDGVIFKGKHYSVDKNGGLRTENITAEILG